MVVYNAEEAGQSRSQNAVGNFSFSVSIAPLGGTTENPSLRLPVDAVRGLGDSRTTVIRHRTSPFGANATVPYPGISTPEAVTLEGSFLFDASDLVALQNWRKLVKGSLGMTGDFTTTGYFRTITVIPFSPGSVDTDKIVAGSFVLKNAWCTRLSISDFDINSPAVCNWSLELEFEDMEVLEPASE